MSRQPLTDRQLNRATLARQMLLERSGMGIVEAVEWLIGLQAQVTEGPYQGLWSRLEGFTHAALTELIVGRQLARATTMRGTLHLHSLPDLIGIRELIRPVLERMWQSNFRRRFGDNDQAEVLAAAIEVIDREPMTAGDVGKALRDRFPTAEPLAMTVLLQIREIIVQVPPTRIWGSGHSPLLARAPRYLPVTTSNLDLTTLVRRYLAAYGPASVNDMQSWCGLTKLGEVFESIRGELVTFTALDGRELFDFPDAPRPDPDTPAPVRFMPLYDNAFLGYDNRRRMLAEDDEKRGDFVRDVKPAVLVDGIISAGWAIESRKGAAVLTVSPYHQLRKTDVAEVEREGLRFLRFMEEKAERFDVRVLEVVP
ncbi:MAG: winged helix DNA-binding protein [Devosia sp.]|uniref:winged helix DNA-binding domain-containing protein n=1 Tax=Devosia sp. TaxID=1871048 RepID=UPI00263451E5|nr:winged helix DNA-binding domain-containing protein [Devosia sp.]MDB5539900.1 winged helix DNA-binding protein [Devosia sp.]